MDIDPFILPFSYVKTDHKIIGTDYLFPFLTTDQILQVKSVFETYQGNHPYKPVWGIKLSPTSDVLDIELYFYQYDPCTRKILYDWNPGLEELITMYSVDVISTDAPNLYYVSYTTDREDKGYSTKNTILQNYYYRYNSTDILKFQEYICSEYLTYHTNIKTTFIADKLHRHMIGIYYDGITSSQMSTFLSQQNLTIPNIPNDMHCSIHIDYDKTTELPIRYGIYGILY